jgi:hypothetical protein
MTLIVENGSIVDNANSYVDLSFFNSYLTTVGISLTLTDSEKEVLLNKAMQYLESFRNSFVGSKVSIDQELQWPRKEVVIDGFDFAETSIPKELKLAQCQLAIEQSKGTLLFPLPKTSSVEGTVIEKTVGPLTKKFSSSSSSQLISSLSPVSIASVNIYLNVLLKGFKQLEVVRA